MVPRSGVRAGPSRQRRHLLSLQCAVASLVAGLAPHIAVAQAPPVPLNAAQPAGFNFSSMAELARSILSGGPKAIDRPPQQDRLPAPHAPASATQSPVAAPVDPTSPVKTAIAPPAPAVKQALRGDTQRTRFVIKLPKKTSFHVSTMAHPNRVIVDVSSENLLLPPSPEGKPVGLVASFRGGTSGPGKSRVVINVVSAVVVEDSTMRATRDGAELLLDIVPIDKGLRRSRGAMTTAMGVGAGAVQPPVPRRALSPRDINKGAFKPTIVLDPGHGGHDSGATKNGAVEKDVVLAFSLKLRDRLNATGRYTVLMTRDTDRFIPLDERREFAERHKAALFIAVHADYANSNARGATIYSLRDGAAERLARSARSEVKHNLLSDGEKQALRKTAVDVGAVESILSDLAVREVEVTKNRTSLFTTSVIKTMGKETEMREKPDRSAAFAVLQTAKVPAVLIELAYVTNQRDAALLKSDAWRTKVSGSIVEAIDNYFSHSQSKLPL